LFYLKLLAALGPIDWLGNKVNDAILGFFANLATDVMSKAFKLITETVLVTPDLNHYIDASTYLFYMQLIAGQLLIVAVLFEAFKQLSGNCLPGDEKSMQTLVMQTIFSGMMIYFLPNIFVNIILKANNLLCQMISSIGVKITQESFKAGGIDQLGTSIASLGGLMILMFLVLGVAFLILGIIGGIRYVELLICYIISPLVAVSIVRSSEAMKTWAIESVSIALTQALQIFLLQILIKFMGMVSGPMMIVLCIGDIVVMVRGPKVIKQYIYGSGVGGGAKAGTSMAIRSAVSSLRT
jgi:hypothetical protein